MTRKRDLKKSEFTAVLSSDSADFLDFVRNGQNFKISYSDFLSGLGVTGTIEARGEVTAIPVLKVLGDVNYIRNILGGAGIAVETSPQDGIQISHNFIVDKTGVPVIIDEGADQPTVRSITAGNGISVTPDSDSVRIALGGAGTTKTVLVYSIDDFPTAVGSVITLEDDTEYQVLNDISTVNRFVFGDNCILSGTDGTLIELEYTGINTMFTATDKNIKIKDIYIKCNSGTVFDISSTTKAHIFRLYTCGVECDTIGNFDNLNIFLLFNTLFYNVITDGFTFTGDTNVALFNIFGINMFSGSGTAIDLGSATFTAFTIDKGSLNINTSGYVLDGLTASGNINSAGIGTISNIYQFGSSTILNNINSFDDRWEMENSAQIVNSNDLALVTNSGTTVSISALGTPAKIAASWVEQDSHRFTTTAGGTFTYDGKGSHLEMTASITADIVTATDSCTFFFYKNGVQISGSAVQRTFAAGSPGNISMIWELLIENGDYLEVWCQNDDTNVDINIYNAIVRFRS